VATGYLLRLDQLPAAGFVAAAGPHAVAAAALFPDAALVTGLRRAGLRDAATAHYVLTVPVLATANGPLDVVPAVLSFGGVAGARAGMGLLVSRADARAGATAMSAGDLGEESHAVTETATAADGTPVVQVTVIWRETNLVDEVAVRGRLGGTGVGDAVVIAGRQEADQ
jgi:lipid-binding SYLF domain-containing protein